MSKLNQKGSVFVIFILFFVAILGVAAFVVYKTISTSTKKIAQSSQALAVAVKEEYKNPFDKNTQYQNPFNSYKNPFDELK